MSASLLADVVGITSQIRPLGYVGVQAQSPSDGSEKSKQTLSRASLREKEIQTFQAAAHDADTGLSR